MSATNPEDIFTFTRSADQERALTELTTTLALIESWVDLVVTEALREKLPHLDAMRELVQRRRATGGSALDTLTNLVGIELHPRSVKEAYAWWESVLATEGMEGREKVWAHPDLLPSPEVLSGRPQAPQAPVPTEDSDGDGLPDLPEFGAMNSASPDFDEELRKLLDGEFEDRGEEPGGTPGGDAKPGEDQ